MTDPRSSSGFDDFFKPGEAVETDEPIEAADIVEVSEPHAPEGYRSEEAKGKYQVAVAVTAGVFFVLQWVLPQFVMPIFFPGAMVGPDMQVADVESGVYWNGRIWYPEESVGELAQGETRLRGLDVEDEEGPGVTVRADLPISGLLAGEERLWIISEGAVGFVEAGTDEAIVVKPRRRLESISRPFWYEERPAVLEDSPDGPVLWSFADGEWHRQFALQLPAAEADAEEPPAAAGGFNAWMAAEIEVVPVDGGYFVFLQMDDTMYVHEGLPAAESQGADAPVEAPKPGEAAPPPQKANDAWQPVGPAGSAWTTANLDGRPAVFRAGDLFEESGVEGMRLEEDQWETFLSLEDVSAMSLSVCPLPQAGRFVVLTESFPAGAQLHEIRDGQRIATRTVGGGMFDAFGEVFGMSAAVGWVIPVVLSVVLLLVVSWLMREYRVTRYVSREGSADYASVMRRGLARGIDGLIGFVPLMVAAYWVVREFDFAKLFNDPFQALATIFGWLGVAAGWWLFYFVVRCVMEGYWGLTPGKWLLGIRTVDLRLASCGFLRAVARNALFFIDSFFDALVGILLIAYTDKWQRLGDMAAGTVVVRAGSLKRFGEQAMIR